MQRRFPGSHEVVPATPTFLAGYQDSFVSGARINVTWFSWLTAVAEIGAGLILGYAGLRSAPRSRAIPSAASMDWGSSP